MQNGGMFVERYRKSVGLQDNRFGLGWMSEERDSMVCKCTYSVETTSIKDSFSEPPQEKLFAGSNEAPT